MKNTIKLCALLAIIFAGCFQNADTNGTKTEVRTVNIRKLLNREPVVYFASQKAKVDAKYIVEGSWEEFKSFFGDRQIYLPIEASFKYTLEFREIQEKDLVIDTVNKTVTVSLPPLHIELDGIKVLWSEVVENVGALRSNFTIAEKNKIAEEALYEMYTTVLSNRDNIYQANQTAEHQITSFLKDFGYTAIVNFELSTPKID